MKLKTKLLITAAALVGVAAAATSVVSAQPRQSATKVALAPAHDGRGGDHLEVAATALGMTTTELQTAMAGGSSLAQVAAQKGVAVQKVIDALVADVKADINQAVTDGKLTQAEADVRLAEVATRVTAMVNGEGRSFGDRHGDRQGGRGGKGRHGFGMHGDSAVLETVLGMTSAEIRAGLESGKTIADLAKEKGVAVQKVIDALTEEARARITDHVNGVHPASGTSLKSVRGVNA